jgi:PAS domain S-box-containing protein
MKKLPASRKDAISQTAETIQKKKSKGISSLHTEAEMLSVIHELEYHQIELELQKEELQLAKEEAEMASGRYAELYYFAPSGFFTLNHLGEIIELNQYGAQLLNKDRRDLKNSRLGFFISEDTRPVFNQFLDKAVKSKNRETCEVTLSIKNSKPTFVTLTGKSVEYGKLCFVAVSDITRRKLAELALEMSEGKYRLLVENSHDVILTLNTQGVITYVSPSLSFHLGYTAEQFVGKPFSVFMHPDELADGMAWLESGFAKGYRKEGFEYRVKHANGSWHWQHTVGNTLKDNEEKIIGFEGIARDITKRKQVEEEIKLRNEEIARLTAETHLSKIKERFITIASHEIRTPLAIIMASTETLMAYREKMDDEQIVHRLNTIKEQVKRMSLLMGNVIDLMKNKEEILSFDPELSDLVVFIAAIVKECNHNTLIQNKVTFESEAVTVLFNFDKRLMRYIIKNLLLNVAKSVPPDSGICITLFNDQHQVRIKVADDRIFSVPANLGRNDTGYNVVSANDNLEGTTLGLVIDKKAIEKHGGTVTTERSNEGAMVYVLSLPVHHYV